MIVSRATFFFTGHHNQLSELHVNCVFIGFEEFNYFTSGAILIINTFGPEICCVLLLPLLLDNSPISSTRGVIKSVEDDCSQEGHGVAALHHMSPPLVHLRRLCMQFLFLRRYARHSNVFEITHHLTISISVRHFASFFFMANIMLS